MFKRPKSMLMQRLPSFVRNRRMLGFLERERSGAGERELRELDKFVAASDLCLDIGSNIGVYSYALARLGARVIAFDPNPQMAKRLRELGIEGVEVREFGLSDKDGEAEMIVPNQDAGHALGHLRGNAKPGADVNRFMVPIRTLDSFDLADVRFIKIDVEGLEEKVVNGALQTIERCKPCLLIEIEERRNEGGLNRIVETLGAFGYECLFMRDGAWRSISEFNLERDQDLDPNNAQYINNFLFLPPGRAIEGIA